MRRYIPGPKQIIELDVGGFMLGELVAFALAFPVQVGMRICLQTSVSLCAHACRSGAYPVVQPLYAARSSALTAAAATPCQFIIGWTFHRGAYRALRRGRANMDVLISVGTNAGRGCAAPGTGCCAP